MSWFQALSSGCEGGSGREGGRRVREDRAAAQLRVGAGGGRAGGQEDAEEQRGAGRRNESGPGHVSRALAHVQAADLDLVDLEPADLRPADGEAADAQSPDREAADRGRAHREGAYRQRGDGRRRARLGAEDRDRAEPGHAAKVARLGCADLPRLLVLVHASWERPHRILDAFEEVDVVEARPLEGDPLPVHDEVDGVVAMGGPMGVDDLDRHPELADEREWIAEAVRRDMPVLGICLGAQLLARALGAEVRPGPRPEIGFAELRVTDPADPLVGALAPSTVVFHWHTDAFDLPEGARSLASSAVTEHQAFRVGDAWGVLFHPEADAALVESWLEVPRWSMEAGRAIGYGGASAAALPGRRAGSRAIRRTTPACEPSPNSSKPARLERPRWT